MAKTDNTVEDFITALKALPGPERDAVVLRIARDEELGRDLLDLATIASHKDEPSRPFREYLQEMQGR